MNRHARLHSRAEEGGTSPKNRRKRINSVSSNKGTNTKAEADQQPQQQREVPNDRRPPTPLSPNSHSHFNLTLPVTIPSFPAYSRPLEAGSIGIDMRRHSDASYASIMGGLHLDLGPSSFPDGPFGRISNGFDIVASPGSAASSSSEGDESVDGSYSTSAEMESQYPSPAFTSYSPSTMQDTMADLEAILANDPLHASMTASSRQHATSQTVVGENDDFDFEHFAASVEGPTASTSLSFENLVTASRLESAFPSSQAISNSTANSTAVQPIINGLDFDFGEFTAVALPTPIPHRPQHRSMSMSSAIPSTSRGSMTMPSAMPASSYPSASLASAYASSFPSLSVMPNGLGLHDASPSMLFEAYLKRKGNGPASTPTSTIPLPTPLPAFYVPSDRRTKVTSLPSGAFASI